jgi:hypothetical protein
VTSTPVAGSKLGVTNNNNVPSSSSGSSESDAIISPIPRKQQSICIGLEVEKIEKRPKNVTPTRREKVPTSTQPRLPLTPVQQAAQRAENKSKSLTPSPSPPPQAKGNLTPSPAQRITRNSKLGPVFPPIPAELTYTAYNDDEKHEEQDEQANFSDLLVRYGKETEDVENLQLHVDPNKITKTYARYIIKSCTLCAVHTTMICVEIE